MITASAFKGKNIAVFGLARTGLAAVAALKASGATVAAWDDRPENVGKAGADATDLYAADFSVFDGLLLAPGVPLTHPEPHALVRKAEAAGIPVFGDTDVFQAARADLPSHQVVAVTGTNGKSTTSTLIDHMIRYCGRPAALGGNIGTGILSIEPLASDGVYVFELSSYQLDLSHTLQPDISVLLNLSPDHLDRHGDMDGYTAAKRRVFELQTQDAAIAVISMDDAPSRDIARSLNRPVIRLSMHWIVDNGICRDGDALVWYSGGRERVRLSLKDAVALRGVHNAQNAAAAWAVGRCLGLADKDIEDAFHTFPGLAHRQENLGVRQGVSYINDSKATNINAAARALACFENIHWIAGGRGKGEPLEPVVPLLSNVKKAWLIGEDASRLAVFLDHRIPFEMVATLDDAVGRASLEATDGDTVLLSPGCAAFDQYRDFEVRGDAFRAIVEQLADAGDGK